MIDIKHFFDQPVKNNLITCENIRKKIATGHGGDYTTGCLLDYLYFKENHKMIAINLNKQQALDADPGVINFTAYLDHNGNVKMLFILEGVKETWTLSQGKVRVL